MKTLTKIIAVILVFTVTLIGQVSEASAFDCLLTFNNDCPFEFDRPTSSFIVDFNNVEPSLCYVGINLATCSPRSVPVRGNDNNSVQYICDPETEGVLFYAESQGCAVGISVKQ
ncbi:MAG: hypothetical protein F6J96_16470 [Symploca sp. SIO1C2]|nr:hypothetical protein [Symploca sp. SIO1C2]